MDVHSCSYECDRPACIKAQRDELVARLATLPAAPAGEVVASLRALTLKYQKHFDKAQFPPEFWPDLLAASAQDEEADHGR